MNKNIRISLAIFIIALLTLLSGQFEEEKKATVIKKELFTVATSISTAVAYQPLIKLKSTTISETRVEVKAKTSGEVVRIGSRQGDFIQKDSVLCSLGIVELNRTEVKAPFSGYIEKIVKPGNFLERGQICATIIQLNPITFVAEVPESDINKVNEGQQVVLNLITGETIEGKLTFVSKSALFETKVSLPSIVSPVIKLRTTCCPSLTLLMSDSGTSATNVIGFNCIMVAQI